MYEYPRAVIIRFDDWETLYVDCKLAAEGHDLRACDLLDAMAFTNIMVRDIRYHLCNAKMQMTLDSLKYGAPPNLLSFGEENLTHVRI